MFDYREAFSRNIGWLTDAEQQILRNKKIAIAGLGGVGGRYFLTFARLGVGRFCVCDFDEFSIQNFNRQSGATMDSLGRSKLSVLVEMVKAINPESEITAFEDAVGEKNVDKFLDGVDLYVDGIDFFSLEARRLVFKKCHEKKIPAITVGPLGMGAAYIAFLPGKMTFEQYFRLDGLPEWKQYLRFLIGLSPLLSQQKYLMDSSAVDLKMQKAPSTILGIDCCVSLAGANALKLLLNRGEVISAPYSLHFDAYLNSCKKVWRPFGNWNPLQQLIFYIAKKKFNSL